MQLFPALPEVVRGMFRRPEALAVCPPGGGPRERGIFLNQTANYGLSQWEATDRILMEDFNSDNSKIDAALKANADAIAAEAAARAEADTALLAQLRSENLWVVLADVTLDAPAQQITLDLSEIDLTQYARIDLSIAHTCNEAYRPQLRVNNLSSGYKSYSSGNPYDNDSLAQLQVPGNTYGAFGLASAILLFNPPMAGTAVQCATLAGGLSYCYAPCFWEDVTSFNIVSGANMAAGTRAVLTGMKK